MKKADSDRAGILFPGAILLVCVFVGALWAQAPPQPETVVELELDPSHLETRAGHRAATILRAKIRAGFHINSHQPLQDYLLPTRAELADTKQFELQRVNYPAGELKSFGFAPEEKLSVYEGTLQLPLPIRAKPETPPGTYTLRIRFHYQACNDRICLRPAEKTISLSLTVRPRTGSGEAR